MLRRHGRLGYRNTASPGRQLVRRPARDNDVILAWGVVVAAGKFDSWGGSIRNPALNNESIADIVLEVRDVPRSVADKMIDEQPDAEIVESAADRRAAALEAERTRLRARLPELDTLLGGGR